ncbi:hypothetical protein TBC1_11346 [Lentimicrobium saccharophilum]|uniref:Uncharacterized protein n=1 Tax=Lentimicrobium saccharophilum TaxID=1678841 RepID=A0A0S7BZN9_9BACT|nr:DUF5689 domain-containing protein [Lentimicrobium saccharophilum]GAP42217.1 hypothetical protein TBC1_11346 [Lentimicrobium saccharophilum]
MKRIWQIFAGLFIILASVNLTSCVDGDFEEPPIIVPTVEFEANRSIQQLKSYYLDTLSRTLTLIEEDIIISGIVVANDESGNLYKKMVIQDETAAIELSLDKTSLYNEYKLGQRIFIKCKGMYVGDYNNLIQLGYIYNGSIGRLPEIYIGAHLYRDGLPGAVPEPATLNLASLPTQSAEIIKDARMSTLVKIENVRFVEVGELFAPQDVDNTNRTLIDQGGKSITVRTSKYCNFAGDTLPGGYGTAVGILTAFGSTWQFTLRSIDDLKEFGGVAPPPPGSGTGTKEDPYDVPKARNLQGQDISGWVKGFIIGSVKSGVTSVTSASDFDFAAPFSSATNVLLASSKDETDYNNCIIVNLPAGSPLRTAVNLLDNPENLKKELKVLGTLRTYFGIAGLRDCPGQEGDFELEGGVTPPPGTVYLDEPFETGIGNFSAYNVLGTQQWNHDASYKYMKMSGYQDGSSHQNEDWLISPSIDLTGATAAYITFDHTINKGEMANLQSNHTLWISTNYNGDTPSTATWEQLTIPVYPAGNNWVFVNSGKATVPASYLGQQNVRIAFKYLCSDNESATWEIKKVKVAND